MACWCVCCAPGLAKVASLCVLPVLCVCGVCVCVLCACVHVCAFVHVRVRAYVVRRAGDLEQVDLELGHPVDRTPATVITRTRGD